MIENIPQKTIGIYCIENLINGKKYVGQANDVRRRINHHVNNFKKDKCIHGENKKLWSSVRRNGIDNFDIYLIEICNISDLNTRETYYINKLDSHYTKNGYNFTFGGDNNSGYSHTKEAVSKIIAALSSRVISEETREKLRLSKLGENNPSYGKHLSEETKRKMGESSSGKNHHAFGKKKQNSSSEYFGVNILNTNGYLYWTVYITVRGKRIYIGQSKDEVIAAKMYDKYVVENNLPNPLNFPEDYGR